MGDEGVTRPQGDTRGGNARPKDPKLKASPKILAFQVDPEHPQQAGTRGMSQH